MNNVSQTQSLSLFTLNTYLFPPLISFFGSKLKKESQRVDLLAQTILKMPHQPDILAFQEIWAASKKKRLYQQIRGEYPYKYEDRYSSFFRLGSGLALYSKYPIERAKLVRFKCWRGLDEFFAKKGFIVAQIKVGDKPLYMVTTHLQAGADYDKYLSPYSHLTTAQVRSEQLKQIKEEVLAFIQEVSPGSTLEDAQVLLAGDLNMHPGEAEYCSIKKTFSQAENLAKKTQKILGTSYNDDGSVKPTMIDHILSVGKPIDGESEIQDCIGYTISDHLAVRAEIQASV